MNKYPRRIVLVTAAVVALLATAAVGSASAKVCSLSGTGEGCGAGHGQVFSGALEGTGNVTFSSGFITLTCASQFKGSVNGSTGVGSISSLTYANCTGAGFEKCITTSTASENTSWTTNVAVSSSPSGTMTVAPFGLWMTCTPNGGGAEMTCRYGSARVGGRGEIAIQGGSSPHLVATKVPLTKEPGSSGFCSSVATWSVNYLINRSLFIE